MAELLRNSFLEKFEMVITCPVYVVEQGQMVIGLQLRPDYITRRQHQRKMLVFRNELWDVAKVP
jgi:hypothetical protein